MVFETQYLSKLISRRNLSGRNILEFTHCVRNSIFCQWRTEEKIIIVPKKFYITKEITTSNITFIYYWIITDADEIVIKKKIKSCGEKNIDAEKELYKFLFI